MGSLTKVKDRVVCKIPCTQQSSFERMFSLEVSSSCFTGMVGTFTRTLSQQSVVVVPEIVTTDITPSNVHNLLDLDHRST